MRKAGSISNATLTGGGGQIRKYGPDDNHRLVLISDWPNVMSGGDFLIAVCMYRYVITLGL